MVRVLSALVLSLGVADAAPREVARHPIHSTLTEISYDPAARLATVRVRAFADDFGMATARWGRSRPGQHAVPPDSLSFEYLTRMISLESAPREFAVLEWCGVRQAGAVLWLCLRARLDRGLEGVRVADRVLNDLFDDEINIVQVDNAGRRTSAVFTRKDVPKVLVERQGQS
jgi:hypothetical protein